MSLEVGHNVAVADVVFVFREVKSANLSLGVMTHESAVSTCHIIKLIAWRVYGDDRPNGVNFRINFAQKDFDGFIVTVSITSGIISTMNDRAVLGLLLVEEHLIQ